METEQIKREPLAARMRPRTLSEIAGQRHIIGEGMPLSRIIKADMLESIILYGPPGTGKTTLASVIANTTKSVFHKLNATTAGKKDVEAVVKQAKEDSQPHILFIDEIHRFNKLQQDTLLPEVESGRLVLIGATTENPYFEVNRALLSRSRIFELKPLTEEETIQLIDNALSDTERGFGGQPICMGEDAKQFAARFASGDARHALNTLELAVLSTEKGEDGNIHITTDIIENCVQKRAITYDKDGDRHYDIISAFIKSMRGSDPDAAVYYLALMLEAGEDIKFIARRILVHAAEDVGLADPQALVVASAAATAVQFVGMPEARIILSEAVLYIATAPKSNAAVEAIGKAQELARTEPIDIPPYLQDAHYKGAGKLGRGIGYKYPHDYPGHYIEQQYLPNSLTGTSIYTPGDFGREREFKEWKQDQGVWGSTGKTAVQARVQAPGTVPQAMGTSQAPPSAPPSPFT